MQDSKYPMVTIISSDPDNYSKDASGATIVPHGRPEFGQKLEDSNYYEFTSGSDINDIMRSVGLPTGEVIMGPTKKCMDAKQPTTKKGRRKYKKLSDDTDVDDTPAKVVHVTWDIPGIGDIKAGYSCVSIGNGCVALYVSNSDESFIPKDYRENSQAVYIMKYKSMSYKLIYSGLKYTYDKYTVYILIGGEYDR